MCAQPLVALRLGSAKGAQQLLQRWHELEELGAEETQWCEDEMQQGYHVVKLTFAWKLPCFSNVQQIVEAYHVYSQYLALLNRVLFAKQPERCSNLI